MRLILCAALLLLAGCTSPAAPTDLAADAPGEPSAGPLPEVVGMSTDGPAATPRVVARLNGSMAAYTGTWLVGVGGSATTWDAAPDLALPRPHGSLLFEMRSQRTGGAAKQELGYRLGFEVVDGDDKIITFAGGSMGEDGQAYHRKEAPRPQGLLTNVTFEAAPSVVSVQASYDFQLAITWFDAETVPDGYSAFP